MNAIKKKKAKPKAHITPARQVGRIREDLWKRIQRAARKASKRDGSNFTQWSTRVLLEAADKELNNKP